MKEQEEIQKQKKNLLFLQGNQYVLYCQKKYQRVLKIEHEQVN